MMKRGKLRSSTAGPCFEQLHLLVVGLEGSIVRIAGVAHDVSSFRLQQVVQRGSAGEMRPGQRAGGFLTRVGERV
jgi:hypothetical protein